MTRIFRISGDLKVAFVFECEECKARAVGSRSVPCRIDTLDGLNGMEHQMNSIQLGIAESAPIGWASYGKGIYKCPNCH